MQCPLITSPQFRALVKKYGENLAYYKWAMGEIEGEGNSSPLSQIRSLREKSFAAYNAETLFKDATKDEETGDYDYEGQVFDSVTGKVIKSMQTRPYTSTDTPGVRAANKAWKYLSEDELARPRDAVVDMTKEQYATHVDAQFQRGIDKGNLLHAKIHAHVANTDAAIASVQRLYDESGILPSELEWLTPDAIRAIVSKTGTNYYSDKGTDKLYTEKVIGSTELGWFGTVDMLVDHGDDLYSLFDLKTGGRFNRLFEDSFLKYGNTAGVGIFDNARNRAKLQLMLYALIIKMDNPAARFRNLDILYIKNQWSITEPDLQKSVNVPAFLEIIQKTLENEQPEIWAKLKAKPHFKQLFDPSSYTTITSSSFDELHPNASSSDLIKHKMLELQGLIMWDSSVADLVNGGHKVVTKIVDGEEITVDGTSKRRKEIAKLMGEIIELKKDPSVHMSVSEANMGWLDRYLGSQSYSTNPYVQLYYKELSKAKQASRDQYELWNSKHDGLLKKLIESKGLKALSRMIGGTDREKLFAFAYKMDTKHRRRLIHSGDTEFKKLTKIEQEYLNFINNSVSGVFTEAHADLIDSTNKVPLAKRIVTYRDWRGRKNVPVTNLDLHNKAYSITNTEASSQPFSYYEGFFPKFAPQIDDIARMHGGYFSKGVVNFLWNQYTTNYFENVFDQWSNDTEAIPMKYLGTTEIDNNDNYTLNLELSIKSFMKHHIYKAKMDEIYTMAQAMKIYLDAQKDLLAEGGADPERLGHTKRLIDWFEDSLNLHVLGRKSQSLTTSSRAFGKVKDERYQKFNWAKFLRSLKQFFAGPTMWLKPLTGLPNFVFASLVTLKEGIKGSLGMSTSNANFGLSEMAAGFGQAFKLFLWDGASNDTFRHSKTYLLMEKFGYLPDNHDWYTSNNELMTTRNQLFTSKTMMLFHSLPEEIIATSLFVAQMKSMKFTKADGTVSNMWDGYEEKTTKLSDGTDYTTIEWVGGVRGQRNISNLADKPEYVDIEGMTTEEINAIKFLYEKIHGGYRGDERIAAEYYVMGELFLQMKKYMPAILKNVWASKGIRQTQGNFVSSVDENGITVMKWVPQVIEGRYKVLLGLLFNFLSIKHSKTDGLKGNRLTRLIGLEFDSSQDWKNLSDAQKEDVKDFLLTTSMYVLLLIGYMKLWDRDDDDTLAKIYNRVANDFAGNVNPLEILKNVKNSGIPTSVNRGYQLLEGTTQLFWSTLLYGAGYDDAALTKEGNFKGSSNVKRNIHFISAWHDLNTGVDNSELFKEYFK